MENSILYNIALSSDQNKEMNRLVNHFGRLSGDKILLTPNYALEKTESSKVMLKETYPITIIIIAETGQMNKAVELMESFDSDYFFVDVITRDIPTDAIVDANLDIVDGGACSYQF